MFEIEACERGNIWLINGEERWHNAWIRLDGNNWLEISIRPCNYPGLNVQTVTVTDEELYNHIRKEFGGGGWLARKINLEGFEVPLNEDDHVIGFEDE